MVLRPEGLLLAVLALYAGLAFELEDSRLRTVLPTLRRGTGRTAIAGSVDDELADLHKEAGGRKQLSGRLASRKTTGSLLCPLVGALALCPGRQGHWVAAWTDAPPG